MQIRESVGDPDILLELSTDNGKITFNLEDKRIEFKMTASETAAFHFCQAVYDLEVEFPNGDRYRVVQGSLALDLEVTR